MFGRFTGFNDHLFDEFRRLEREMDHMFGAGPSPRAIRSTRRGAYPPINIGSTAKQVDVYFFAAGVDQGSLDISIQNNLLTVDGNRELFEEEGADYYRKERYDGKFHRVITLPEDVDPEQVEASYNNGILHVCVQRRQSAQPRQIEVK
jgi:HSP20 family protein